MIKPFLFCSGLDQIEKLQTHENTEVYNRALAIIDRYFSEDQVSLRWCHYCMRWTQPSSDEQLSIWLGLYWERRGKGAKSADSSDIRGHKNECLWNWAWPRLPHCEQCKKLLNSFFLSVNLFQETDEEVAPQATNKGFQFGTPQQVPVGGFHFWTCGNPLSSVHILLPCNHYAKRSNGLTTCTVSWFIVFCNSDVQIKCFGNWKILYII